MFVRVQDSATGNNQLVHHLSVTRLTPLTTTEGFQHTIIELDNGKQVEVSGNADSIAEKFHQASFANGPAIV